MAGFFLLPALAGTAEPERPTIMAQRADRAPTVDGYFDEPAWSFCQAATNFVQQQPDEGALSALRTEVRVLYDDSNLYFGVTCFDPQPERVVANVQRRDASLEDNDSFEIILDTFGDRQNGFHFATNPLGAQYDAQIRSEARSTTIEPTIYKQWDGVWRVASRLGPQGWTAEIAIPLSTLSYPAKPHAWGVNFKRIVRRMNEQSFWAAVPRAFNLYRLSLAGSLLGLDGVGNHRNLAVKPFVRAASNQEAGADVEGDFDAGVDVKLRPTPALTLDVTWNTDFAEVEVDEEQINLTRFPLFFPEKRDFFLENQALFEFGDRLQNALFFTRRIGLSPDGRTVPLQGGARLSGKMGRTNIGILDVQSEGPEEIPASNYAVVRVSQDILQRSSVGAIFVNRQGEGSGDYNRGAGFDADLNLTRNLRLFGFVSKTATPGKNGEDLSWNVSGEWVNNLWQFRGSVLDIEENHNPEMGFVPRAGIRNHVGSVYFTPKPEGNSRIRQFLPHVVLTVTTDPEGREVTRFEHYDYEMVFRAGSLLSFDYNKQFELLDRPFPIAPGITIPPGEYDFGWFRFEYYSDPSRDVYGRVTVDLGDFWDGTRRMLRTALGYRFGRRLSTELRWERNDLDLAAGSFVTDLLGYRLEYQFNPRLYARGLIQYNSLSQQVLTNLRLNFIYAPESDIFLVYNERTTDLLGVPISYTDRQLILKVTYRLGL